MQISFIVELVLWQYFILKVHFWTTNLLKEKLSNIKLKPILFPYTPLITEKHAVI